MPPVGQQVITTRNNKKSSAGSEVSSSETRKIETIVTTDTKQDDSQPNITYVVTEPKEIEVKTKKSKKSKSTKLLSGKLTKTQSSSSVATEDVETSVKIVELGPGEELNVTSSVSDSRFGDSGISQSNTKTYTSNDASSSGSVESKDVNKKTEKVKMIGGKIKKFFSGDKSDSTENVNKVDEMNKTGTLKRVSDIVTGEQSITKSESRSSFKEMKASSMSSKKITGTKVIKTSTTTVIGPDGKEVTTVTVSDPVVTQNVSSSEKNSLLVAEGEAVQITEGGKTDYKMDSALTSYSDSLTSINGHTKADITTAFITNEAKSTLAGIENKSHVTEIKAQSTSDGIESTDVTKSSTSNISHNTSHDSLGSQAVDSVKMIGGKIVKLFGKSGDSKSKSKKKSQQTEYSDSEKSRQIESIENKTSIDQNIQETTESSKTSSSRNENREGNEQYTFTDRIQNIDSTIDTSSASEKTRVIGGKLIKEKHTMPQDRWNKNSSNNASQTVVAEGGKFIYLDSNETVESGDKSSSSFKSSSFQSSSNSEVLDTSENTDKNLKDISTEVFLKEKHSQDEKNYTHKEKENTRIIGGKLIKSNDDLPESRWNVTTGTVIDNDNTITDIKGNLNKAIDSGENSSSHFNSTSTSSFSSSKITASTSGKMDGIQQDSTTIVLDTTKPDMNQLDVLEHKQNTRIVGGKLIKSKEDFTQDATKKITRVSDESDSSINGKTYKINESKEFEESQGKSISNPISSMQTSSSSSFKTSSSAVNTKGYIQESSGRLEGDDKETENKSTSIGKNENTRIVGGKLIKSKDDIPEDRWTKKPDRATDLNTMNVKDGENYDSSQSTNYKSTSSKTTLSETGGNVTTTRSSNVSKELSSVRGENSQFESSETTNVIKKSGLTYDVVSSSDNISSNAVTENTLNKKESGVKSTSPEQRQTRIVGGKLIKSKDDIPKDRRTAKSDQTTDSMNVRDGENYGSSQTSTTYKMTDSFETGGPVTTTQTSNVSKITSSVREGNADTHFESSETTNFSQKSGSIDNISSNVVPDNTLNKREFGVKSNSLEQKQNTRIVGGKLIKSKDDIPKDRWTEKPDRSSDLNAMNVKDGENYDSSLSTTYKSTSYKTTLSETGGLVTTTQSSNVSKASSSVRGENSQFDSSETTNVRKKSGLTYEAVSSSDNISSNAVTENTLNKKESGVNSTSLEQKQNTRIVGGKLIKSKDDIPKDRWTEKPDLSSDLNAINVKDGENYYSSQSTTKSTSSGTNLSEAHGSTKTTQTSNVSKITSSLVGEKTDSRSETFAVTSDDRNKIDEEKVYGELYSSESNKNHVKPSKETTSNKLSSNKLSFIENERLANARNNTETSESVKIVGGKVVKVPGIRPTTGTTTSTEMESSEISHDNTGYSTSSQVISSTSHTTHTSNKKSGTLENPYVKYDERPVKPAKNLDEILASEVIHSSEKTEGQTVKMVGGKIIKHGKMKSPTRKVTKTENVEDIFSDNTNNSSIVRTDVNLENNKQLSSTSHSETISQSSSLKTEKTFIKESSVQEIILSSDGKLISSSTRTSRGEPNTQKNVRMVGGKLVKTDDTKLNTFTSDQTVLNEQYAQDVSSLQSNMKNIIDKLNVSPTTKRSTKSKSNISPEKQPVSKSPERAISSSETTLKSTSNHTSNIKETSGSTDMVSTYHEPVCTCPPEEHFISSDFTDNIMSQTYVVDERHSIFERDDKTSRGVSNIRDETDLTRKIISNTHISDESIVSNIYDENKTIKSLTDDRTVSDHDKRNRTLVRQDTFDKSDDRTNVRDIASFSDISTRDTRSSSINTVTDSTYITSTTTNVQMIGGKIVKENVTVTRKKSPSPQRRSPTKIIDRSPTPTRKSDKSPTPKSDRSPVKKLERTPSKERGHPGPGKSPDKSLVPHGQSPKPDKTTERGIRMVGGKIIKSEQYVSSEHTSNKLSETHFIQENVNIVHSSSSHDIKILDITDVRNISNEKITKEDRRTITGQEHKESIAINEKSTAIDKKSTEKVSKKTKDRKDKKTETVVKEQCICEICTCGRHRCPHKVGEDGPPMDWKVHEVPKTSLTQEEFHPIPLDKVERPKIQRLHTQLTLPSGELDDTTAYKEDYPPKKAEKGPRYRLEDHLHLEGDFNPQRKDEYPAVKGDRAPVKKPEDNLKPEGDFERPTPQKYSPGERAPIVKHPDNLKPEGGFERPPIEKYGPAERAPIVKHADNLKPEGDFDRPKVGKFVPADRPKAVKPQDNLKPEGDFERPVAEKYGPGERAPIVKHPDNLKPEGDFERPLYEKFSPGERPKAIKPKDNLKPEGDFERPQASKFSPADRPKAIKPQDNLKPEGEFERPSQPLVPMKGERAIINKYEDHHITGGEFTGITTQQVEFTGEVAERPPMIRRNTWTKLEGEFSSETTSQTEFKRFDSSTQRTELVKKRSDNLTVGEGKLDVLPRNKDDHPEKWAVKPEKPKRHQDNLRSEGGKFFSETSSSETFQAHQVLKKEEIRRQEDNLVQSGEMTFITSAHEDYTEKTPEKVKPQRRRTWTKQDGEIYFQTTAATEFTQHSTADVRQTQIRHVDNLITGGTFEGRPKDDYMPVTAERPKQKKLMDNLRPEGDFERPKQAPHEMGERPKAIKPKDNLKPEGDFERPIKELLGPADRAAIVKHPDNLKLEGDFEDKPRPKAPEKGERAPIKKPKDNLYPEGEFERPEYPEFQKAERPKAFRPYDNVRPEGEFERPIKEKPKTGERPEPFKKRDNLKPEGAFEGRPKNDYGPKVGDRAPVKKPQDNLYPEGDFERPEYPEFQKADRPKAFKPHDNLKPEGDFERPVKEKPMQAERVEAYKLKDNLRPEGDFEGRPKDDYGPKIGDRAPVKKPQDNLYPEGDFERPEYPEFQKADRPKAFKPHDNLKPEGEFERPIKEKPKQGERVEAFKSKDNLKPEGEFEGRPKDDYGPKVGDRAPVKKPQDNLYPEGEFERPEYPEFQKADRPKAFKPHDNLKPEGEFERPIKEKPKQGERVEAFKTKDNLKPEGEFEGRPKDDYGPKVGDRAPVKKPQDNLYPEGEFEQREYPEFQKAERPKAFKPHDNLKPEGEFERPIKEKPKQAERVEAFKSKDNLKPEGEFEGRPKDDYGPKVGDRAPVKKPQDNLYPEGEFERPEYPEFQKVERPKAFKPHDNLKPEGEFERPVKEKPKQGERVEAFKLKDNLKPEGEFEGRPKDDYGPKVGDRAPVKKPQDNLYPEGEFERREYPEFQKAERPKAFKPHDNLKPEGDFERPIKEKPKQAEKVEAFKSKDNLKPEGEFEGRPKDDYGPKVGDRAPVKKPQDNLYPEGDFEKREHKEFQKSDRPKAFKPLDNLKPEGEFERPIKEKLKQAERVQPHKVKDNLKPEGEFEGRAKDDYGPKVGDRAPVKKPKDNLYPEGDFERPHKVVFKPADKTTIVKHEDNLKMVGEFAQREITEIKRGERADIVKHKDNLKSEGLISTTRTSDDFCVTRGERADVVFHKDNLRMEGEMEIYRSRDEYNKVIGEKATIIRREDNLIIEGEHVDIRRRNDYSAVRGERSEVIIHKDNLKTEGKFESSRTSDDFTIKKAEKITQVRHKDNLKPEGEFVRPTQVDYRPTERPTAVKPKDNLKPEGDFERPTKESYGPGERAPIVKHADNLRPEGDFEKRISNEYVSAERPKAVKPKDNLKPEGDFERPAKEFYGPGERAPIVKHADNLRLEGDFEKRSTHEYVSAERPKSVKPKDNLKPEGNFVQREAFEVRKGERAAIVKHTDNLKSEGTMLTSKTSDDFCVTRGERADINIHEDNLRMEGKIETHRSRDDFKNVSAERVDIIKRQDNLFMEGDFKDHHRRDDYSVVKGDRTEVIIHEDNLRVEGKFDYSRSRDDFKSVKTERVTSVKHSDNLKPEGDFERPAKEKYGPGDRPKAIIPKDNLKPEGVFERPEKEKYGPGERAPIVKHPDNLKPEGEFERPSKDKFHIGERSQAFKPKDNLRTEGEFERPQKITSGTGGRAPIVKHPDNLKPEGDFERPIKQRYGPGERPKPIIPKDNLRQEGDFERPTKGIYGPGERAAIVKHSDNLRTEGDFQRPKLDQYEPGERSKPIRHPDNLKMEGDVTYLYKKEYSTIQGDRAEIVKHKDNLKMEGKFEGTSKSKQDYKTGQGDRPIIQKPKDNLMLPEGKVETHTTSRETFKIQRQENNESQINKRRHVQSQITLGNETSAFGTYSKKTASIVSKQIQENNDQLVRSQKIEEHNIVQKRAVSRPPMTIQRNVEMSEREETCRQQVERREQQQMISRSEQKMSKSSSTSMSNIKQSVEQETRSNQQIKRIQQPCEIHGRKNQLLHSEEQRKIVQQRNTSDTQDHAVQHSEVRQSGRKTWEKRDFDADRRNYDINQENKLMKINENLREQNIIRGSSVTRDYNISHQNCQLSQHNVENKSSYSTENILRSSTASNVIQNQSSVNSRHSISNINQNQSTLNSRSSISDRNLSFEGRTQHTTSSNSRSSMSSSNFESRTNNTETKNIRSSHAASSDFQKTIRQEGFGESELQAQLSTPGYHRKSIISSSSGDVSNAVLHRKSFTSATEAEHSLSSSGALQRQSLKNLDGQFMTTSQDRRSLSTLHRQGIDEHISNIRKSDNLTVGGKFYGQTEANRSYGNYSTQQTVVRSRQSNTSNISLGSEMSRQEIASLYKKEFTPRVSGPCPAATIDKSQNVFKHTRDTKTHKFYLPNVASGSSSSSSKPAQR